MTHRGGVDEDDNDHNQQDQDDAPNDVPLVVAPDNELEGLPGRREPQEWGGWATGEGGDTFVGDKTLRSHKFYTVMGLPLT